jgi:hypothetical protein
MNLAFPLTREPRHEARIREALQICLDFLLERLGGELVATILTGSFARGEGTVLARGRELRALGDFEFFVVFPHDGDARKRCLVEWGRAASACLAARGLRADVEFGAIDVEFFHRRARPSIFVYDLREHGKVLWGSSELLAALPRFRTDEIPPEDALYLLFNRVIEQLEAWDRLERRDGDGLLQATYQRLKLMLDLAGSALAFCGLHTPSYARRPDALGRLVAETPSLGASLAPTFVDDVAAAARAKIAPAEYDGWPDPGRDPAAEQARLRRDMVAVVPAVAAILRWELSRLLGDDGDLPDLLDRFATSPSLSRRVWDWGKFVLNPLPAPRPVSHLKAARLLLQSTPRALLYAAGAVAYLGLPGSDAAIPGIARRLPLAGGHQPPDAAEQRRAIVALWRWCVRNS